MPEKPKTEYNQLEAGDELPASSYKLDGPMVTTYLKAVEESSSLYQETQLVPPMAVAAYAMTALSESVYLPPGTIHISQELDFTGTVSINDTITSFAKVSRKQSRGKFHFLNIEFTVFNQKQQTVLVGKTSFILPEQDDGQ